jgi:hypothetical protein
MAWTWQEIMEEGKGSECRLVVNIEGHPIGKSYGVGIKRRGGRMIPYMYHRSVKYETAIKKAIHQAFESRDLSWRSLFRRSDLKHPVLRYDLYIWFGKVLHDDPDNIRKCCSDAIVKYCRSKGMQVDDRAFYGLTALPQLMDYQTEEEQQDILKKEKHPRIRLIIWLDGLVSKDSLTHKKKGGENDGTTNI